MRVYGIALLGIVVAAVLLGCITRKVKYQPDTSLDAERAKAIIRRVIEEQPATVAPSQIEVTDEYIKTIDVRVGHVVGVIREVPTTIYFTSIGDVRLYKKRGRSATRYAVFIYDKADVVKHKIYTFNRDHAEACVDAMTTMVRYARERGDPLF